MMTTFILRLLVSATVVSLLIITILLTKKCLKEHMSKQTHYKIWYFLFVPLLTSLFPGSVFPLTEIYQRAKGLFFMNNSYPFQHEKISSLNESHGANVVLLHDFAISVNKSTPDFVYYPFLTVWMVGMILLIGVAIYGNYQIYQIKKSAIPINNQKINEMLEVCKEAVGVKKKVWLKETSLVASPVTFGLLQPYILLPKNTREEFSLNELKYVLLHELTHQKSKDVLVNYLMLLLQTVYWFNPFVWWALKRMRIDRELACDASVLTILDESGYIEYGHTIIHFADKINGRAYSQLASGLGGTKKHIKQRIQSIANYTADSHSLKWKGKGICTVLGIFVICLLPLTAVIASPDDVYHFHAKNTVYEDLSSYFKGYHGSFVLYDADKEHYQIYNREMSEQRISPNSTYKIYSALFALEKNVISPTNNKLVWDGTAHSYKEWNRNHNLSTAMSSSANWYFQELDQKVGRKQLQSYFHKIKYGNENLSGNLDSYWIESTLKISPVEQVQLLYAMEENGFGFKQENIRAVKNAIFIDEQNHSRLYGKTGTGMVNEKTINGWFVGFVEKDDRTYYFAVNIQNKNGQANGRKAVEIARQILQDKHIY
ncbi:BlaR1 family beta-lactam sensor/signal transducer [Siminovitchia sediminis]|uniref:BlaR1 family beta-lactam sensor/signal transducer n=1 Tax=Siminovitchia sediminis TaxID=1274353 RepID=A0ABW4KIP5_9BACI